MSYQTLSDNELTALASELERDYELLAGNRLSLDLSRGKPAPDQLALSHGLDDVIINAHQAGGRVEVTISDDGPGVAEGDHRRGDSQPSAIFPRPRAGECASPEPHPVRGCQDSLLF